MVSCGCVGMARIGAQAVPAHTQQCNTPICGGVDPQLRIALREFQVPHAGAAKGVHLLHIKARAAQVSRRECGERCTEGVARDKEPACGVGAWQRELPPHSVLKAGAHLSVPLQESCGA